MCGIAGMAGTNDGALVKVMLDRIRHRGPDDAGVYSTRRGEDGGAAFGNVRLSIIDLSPAGHQPMANEDRSVWVAYNGEIYNFQDLRRELEADGHQFHSQTDTEILPHLYEKYGADMVKRLNGIFAFALWDEKLRSLFLFRDRMGVKPLYYVRAGSRLFFASEIKALLACQEVHAELDPVALQQYLALLYVPNPGTLFKGILKLPPAHMLVWRDGQVEVRLYWEMKSGEYFRDSEADLAAELRKILIRATKRQLISDVPVGFFLSGGLDSSTLVACATRASAGPLCCYTIAFPPDAAALEQSDEDSRYAKLVAEHFGAEFRKIRVHPNVVDLLPKTVWHLDDAVADHAAIATLLICEAAGKEVTVLLSGQGGDEIFGGYRVHLMPKLARLLQLIPRPLLQGPAIALLRWIGVHNGWLGVRPGTVLAASRFLQKLVALTALCPCDQYIRSRCYLHGDDLADLLSPEIRGQLAQGDFAASFREHFAASAGQDFLNQMLYVDCKTFLPDLNLDYSDKLSMACSIESRVPLLDNEVVDFMQRVPPHLKIKGFTQKYLLKKAMQPMLPANVIHRRKAGFGLPVRSWLRNDLHEMVHDLLSEDRIRRRGLLDAKMVSSMLQQNDLGRCDFTLSIWSLLVLEIWQQIFIDQEHHAELSLLHSAEVNRCWATGPSLMAAQHQEEKLKSPQDK